MILQGSLWQTSLEKGQSQAVIKNLAIYKTDQRNKQFMVREIEKPWRVGALIIVCHHCKYESHQLPAGMLLAPTSRKLGNWGLY